MGAVDEGKSAVRKMLFLSLAAIAIQGPAFAGQIDQLAWNQSNIANAISAGAFAGGKCSIPARSLSSGVVLGPAKPPRDVSAQQLLAHASASASILAVADTANSTDWIAYHNTATGLSFRYPAYLRIHERDPRSFGLPEAEEITDLVGDTKVNPGTIVLRFIVNRGETTPETAAAKSRSIREAASSDPDSRESVTFMELDGHEAPVSVGCGRGACHWSVNILQPRECKILSMLAGADADEAVPPPRDGIFPLLSIIESVHFAAGNGSRNS
jgi:hypothetical protein